VVLKHIDEIFLRVNKGVRDGVLPAEDEESLLAFQFEHIEKFLGGKLVEQPKLLTGNPGEGGGKITVM
jgi:hypothetical protein